MLWSLLFALGLERAPVGSSSERALSALAGRPRLRGVSTFFVSTLFWITWTPSAISGTGLRSVAAPKRRASPIGLRGARSGYLAGADARARKAGIAN